AARALAAEVDVAGAVVESRAEIKIVAGDGTNNFATPQNVRLQRSAARARGGDGGAPQRLSVLLPKRSVSIVVLRVSR
ncbi:MAG TPA: hypothetical protein VM870_09335, partial [Pyrinomonadaceae bacterium]|nr:hypothetical protein [Pyrinomonadaceae bacterium]